MTLVHAFVSRPDDAGLIPANGVHQWKPTARRIDPPATLVMPSEFTARLGQDYVALDGETVIEAGVDGEYWVEVEPCPLGTLWAWKVVERVNGADRPRWFAVPDQATIEYTELLENHQVDPDTLDPTEDSSPAWVADLDARVPETGTTGFVLTKGAGATNTWEAAGSGSGAVDSVNGEVGAVVLDAADVGAATAAQGATADAASAGLAAHEADVANPHAVTKAQVGLANVDNTSDANKPVSTATQTALNLKANTADLAAVATSGDYDDLIDKPTALPPSGGAGGVLSGTYPSPGFAVDMAEQSELDAHTSNTSNPHVVTKAQVGLANVDNVQQQPSNANLTTIAGLTPTTDNVIQSVAGSWASRTMAQLKTALGLTKSDVGLANVDNTSDANKPVSSATQTALNAKKTDSMTTNRLLGRGTASTGAIEEITLGTNLSLSGTTLNASAGGGGGDVTGPVSSTDNAVTRFDGTTGDLIQNSAVTIDDSGNIATSGTVDGRDLSTDGTKLDGIEAGADVTDAANVDAAGAVMNTDISANGLVTRTASGTYTSRTVTGTANRVTVTNGDGVSGNPTLDVGSNVYTSGGTDVSVADGGTGRSTATTAYGLIAAGTTAAGVQQTITPGTSGHLLKSNGASALASFSAGTPADVGLGSVTASRLIGRGSAGGAGNAEAITLGTNLSMSGTTLNASGGGGSGDVVGPASATDEALVRFDTATGKLVQNSPVTLTDAGDIVGVNELNAQFATIDDATLSNLSSDNTFLNGPSGYAIQARTATATMTTANPVIQLLDTTSGAVTLTLPTQPEEGYVYIAKKVAGGNTAVLAAGGSGNIDGAASVTLGLDEWVVVVSDAVDDVWNIIGRSVDSTTVAAAGAVMDGDFTTDGIMARTAAGAYASRTITGTANRITVTNGDGDAGNPTLDVGTDVYTAGGTDVPVTDGGTGRSTATTAYGLIAAGTTATGAQQTISPGTTGHFLKSAGGSALASFAAIAQSDVTNLTTDLAAKAPLASPTFTGTATAADVSVTGSYRSGITAQTTGVTLTTSSTELQTADATSAAFTITLPATTTPGIRFTIKKIDSSTNQVSIAATSIDGVATRRLHAKNHAVTVVSTTTSGTWRQVTNAPVCVPTGTTGFADLPDGTLWIEYTP